MTNVIAEPPAAAAPPGTRQRILAAAAPLFQRHGTDGVGVDAIMHAAGLTHGGFYAHFPSKEALIAECAATSLARSAARWQRVAAEAPAAAALAQLVDAYLDPRHLQGDVPSCVLATLGPDIARRPAARAGITASLRQMVAALARCLPGRQAARKRQRALASLSCLVGAVTLARLADDPALATEFLDAARAELIG
ncbi:MAG: TetR/AcrR family transcriptional regulator [Rhodospirillales bacterium]|nr:TetR/AcrR family transcriptional regulator [Rhodospirillales bacterium]